jgi:hypothetical protein
MPPNRKNSHKGYDEKYRKNEREHLLGPPFSARRLRGQAFFDSRVASAGKPVKSQAQSAEQIQSQENDQDHSENAYAAARPPSPISVIAAAAPEHKHENNNQQNQKHDSLPMVSDRLRLRLPTGSMCRSQDRSFGATGLNHRRTRTLDELILTADDLTALREKVFLLKQGA